MFALSSSFEILQVIVLHQEPQTDHVLAVCRGTGSAFLCAAQRSLHLLYLLLQHLLLLGYLLVTVQTDKRMKPNRPLDTAVIWIRIHLTLWPGCVAPRSPPPASGCCPPCPPLFASAFSPPPGAFGCSSEGQQHNTPALMSHWKYTTHTMRPSFTDPGQVWGLIQAR